MVREQKQQESWVLEFKWRKSLKEKGIVRIAAHRSVAAVDWELSMGLGNAEVTSDFEKSCFFGVQGRKTWLQGVLVRNAGRGIVGNMTSAMGTKCQGPRSVDSAEREGTMEGLAGLFLEQ